MLRACVLEFQGKWEDDLPLAEFSYNNSYQFTIRMARLRLYIGEIIELHCAYVIWMRH